MVSVRNARYTLAHWIAVGSHLGLIAFAMAWISYLSNTPEERISLLLVLFVGPLLLTLRGVLRAHDRTLLYSSLIGLWYVLHGGIVWWTQAPLAAWGLLELSLALGHILSASYTIRWQT